MDQTDIHLDFIPTSGRHSCVSWDDEVRQLAEQFNRADIFNSQPGQYHSCFPSFPRNYPLLFGVYKFKKALDS